MSEETKKTPRTVSRREFLRDAGIVVGGTAVSSAFFLSACGKEVEVTKTVTTTAPGSTVTTTAPGATSTITKTAADNTVTVTKYTCPVCNQEFDSLEALKTHFDDEHIEDETSSNLKSLISLTINGNKHEFLVKNGQTLLSLIHDTLGLTGTKYFCDQGACGGCTVILNGRPVLSCMTLAAECNNASVQTVEGIAKEKHPLIDTYVENHCMQCGYCTPGFIVTAKALLDRNANASEADIREALAGNLCRCGTYPQHVPAIIEAEKRL